MPKQIVGKLRQIDTGEQGKRVPQACKEAGIVDQTIGARKESGED
jgi:hypothetical protein